MYRLYQRKLKDIDEYLAADLSEFNNYQGQRQLKVKHLNELIDEIENGKFLTGDIAIAILTYEDNRKVLVNGQHQLKAIIRTGISIHAVYQEYICESPSDLSELYRRFDNHQARTLSDVLTPEAAALGVTWKRAIVRLVVSAAVLDGNKQYSLRGRVNESKLDKVKHLSAYLRQGGFVNHIMKDSVTSYHLHRAPVVLAMFDTWEKDKVEADKFWKQVRDGADLPPNSPALRLRNYLMTTGLTKSRTTKTDVATTREMYVKCIHAWNAWRRGATTNLKYIFDADLPKPA